MALPIIKPEEARDLSNESLIHLRLLFAFHKLRVQIGSQDGLWGIWDDRLDTDLLSEDERQQGLAKLKEKRWFIYLARAVHRYQAWWTHLGPRPLTEWDTGSMHGTRYAKFAEQIFIKTFTEHNMIPLDVLMVWHTHMLNPRLYLEDAMRKGRGDIWCSGMPWDHISRCLSSGDIDYAASEDAKVKWETGTGLSWDNTDDPSHVDVACPSCKHQVKVPWTTCWNLPKDMTAAVTNPKATTHQHEGSTLQSRLNLVGYGLADGNPTLRCENCEIEIDKDLLSFGKFIQDADDNATKSHCMPATLLDPRTGMPELDDPDPKPKPRHGVVRKENSALTSPNRLARRVLLDKTRTKLRQHRQGTEPRPSIDMLREIVNGELHYPRTLAFMAGDDRSTYERSDILFERLSQKREAKSNYDADRDGAFGLLTVKTRVVVRRMLAQYTDNWSPFALDLRAAMLRQSLFIDKMYKFDWLHGPDSPGAMTRAVTKYARFLQLAKDNPKEMVVPTLDVDLAWHTHQLSPKAYYHTTTRHLGKFLDHDDKVDEKKLSTSFDWMSEAYFKKYKEIYSECLCWYCQVTRTSRTSSVSIFLGESKRQKAFKDLWIKQMSEGKSRDEGPHLSAHNAVSVQAIGVPVDKKARKSYNKHVRRQSSGAQLAEELSKKLERKLSTDAQPGQSRPEQLQGYIDHWGYSHPEKAPWACPAFFDQAMYTSSVSSPRPGSGINTNDNIGGCATGCGSLSRCGARAYTLEGVKSDVHDVPADRSNDGGGGGGGCGGCGG